MENVNVSELADLCRDTAEHGNDGRLSLRIGRDAEGTPYKAEILAGGELLFDLPIEIEPPLPDSTPARTPNPEVEIVKSNILGWLNLALKETARLNVEGRYGMCDRAMTAIQLAAKDVRRCVC